MDQDGSPVRTLPFRFAACHRERMNLISRRIRSDVSAQVTPLPPPARAAPAVPSFPKLNARVIDSYVLPRFRRLAESSGKLTEDLARACAGNKKAAEALKKNFADTVLAWAAVEFLRFGPMSQIGRPERFDFWPDPRGVTLRQVNPRSMRPRSPKRVRQCRDCPHSRSCFTTTPIR